jgi:hypothetical protein
MPPDVLYPLLEERTVTLNTLHQEKLFLMVAEGRRTNQL